MLRHAPTTRWEACRSGLRIAFRHEAAGPASSAAFAHVGGHKTRRKAGGLWAPVALSSETLVAGAQR
jgi:hypothetical protein